MAFDAAGIDIDSVRFGPRSQLFDVAAVGGTPEKRGKLDLKKSVELDEKTKDKDEDAVMEFRAADSGLLVGSTEACVRGEYDAGGTTYTFFGCDSVLIDPH